MGQALAFSATDASNLSGLLEDDRVGVRYLPTDHLKESPRDVCNSPRLSARLPPSPSEDVR